LRASMQATQPLPVRCTISSVLLFSFFRLHCIGVSTRKVTVGTDCIGGLRRKRTQKLVTIPRLHFEDDRPPLKMRAARAREVCAHGGRYIILAVLKRSQRLPRRSGSGERTPVITRLVFGKRLPDDKLSGQCVERGEVGSSEAVADEAECAYFWPCHVLFGETDWPRLPTACQLVL
jgi:hypothetical protein